MGLSNQKTIEERILAITKARKDSKPITPRKLYGSISPKDVSKARRKYFSLKPINLCPIKRAKQIVDAGRYLLNEYNGEGPYQNGQ